MFANGRSQFLLDRLGRCFQLFVSSDSTSSHEFACQFGLAFFLCEKHSKPRGNRAASASVFFNGQRPAIVTSGAGRYGWLAQTIQIAIQRRRCVCVGCVCSVRAGACACACVRACVMCLQYTIIIFDAG